MLNKSYLSRKMSEILFLEINNDKINKIFNTDFNSNVFMPFDSKKLVDGIKCGNEFNEISVNEFIEGMFQVIGCNEEFKYSKDYNKIINENKWTIEYVKKIANEKVKNNLIQDAYLILRGIYTIESSETNYDKLLFCAKKVSEIDKNLLEENKNIVEHGKEKKFILAYFYESLLFYENENYVEAWDSLNLYFAQGGKEESEITDYRSRLKILSDYEKGKECVNENPRFALEMLLPLLDEIENDSFLYYYIAVAYRNIGIYEKAIYYLNEAMRIDNSILEVFNEMALNYACLGDYDMAINYFRKVFEVTKDVGVCTNLVMCYINKGDLRQARIHFDIANKIDADDEIVQSLKNILKENL